MEEIILDTIEWSAPEYDHKERTMDWFWTIGLIAVVAAIIEIWLHNYPFAIFILISGACLILFTLRHPQEIGFTIETEGLIIGNDKHEWKTIKGFKIKKGEERSKLLIQTGKYFLPVYTIPLPNEIMDQVKDSLKKVIPQIELEESHSMMFMEKLGF